MILSRAWDVPSVPHGMASDSNGRRTRLGQLWVLDGRCLCFNMVIACIRSNDSSCYGHPGLLYYTDSTNLCKLADIVGFFAYSNDWLLLDISCYRIRIGIVVAAVEAVPEPQADTRHCQLAEYVPWNIPWHKICLINKQVATEKIVRNQNLHGISPRARSRSRSIHHHPHPHLSKLTA